MMLRSEPRYVLNVSRSVMSERAQHCHHHCVCPGCLQYEQLCHKQGVKLFPSWWVLLCPAVSSLVFHRFLSTYCRCKGLLLHLTTLRHTHTHKLYDSSRRGIGPSKKLQLAPIGILTRNASKQATAHPGLRTRGHRVRLCPSLTTSKCVASASWSIPFSLWCSNQQNSQYCSTQFHI